MSGSSSLGLHFVKQAAPSATLTCNVYPECIEFTTIIKVISIQMSAAAGGGERLLNGGKWLLEPEASVCGAEDRHDGNGKGDACHL